MNLIDLKLKGEINFQDYDFEAHFLALPMEHNLQQLAWKYSRLYFIFRANDWRVFSIFATQSDFLQPPLQF